jgi:ATP:ADP antiporter, AAA family
LVAQTIVAPMLLARLGPGIVLCVLPLAQVVGLCSLAMAPSLGALAALAISTRVATHGLTRPARELLFTVVARDDKYRAKNEIDTVGYRFGDFVASWVALAGASAAATISAIVPLALAWLWLARRLGVMFGRACAEEGS